MQTWHIHIKGQVQGVGFRPFIFLLAQQYHLNGWVNNDIDGVHIEFNAGEKKAKDFLNKIIQKAPNLAYITTYEIRKTPPKDFTNFEIKHSQTKGQPNLLLTPDAAICQDCSTELFQVSNRRSNYPFITCTNCGPRYSIILSLPYDRPHTTMDVFQMCPNCQEEYGNSSNRRYYSQTNSCPVCAIKLELLVSNSYSEENPLPMLPTKESSALQRRKTSYKNSSFGNKLENDIAKPSTDFTSFDNPNLIERIVQLWQKGKIVAIKGIGGYLLTCDANNQTAVQLLRQRKHRPSKPFALMFPSLDKLKKAFRVGKEEEVFLTSSAAPIVLLQGKVSDTFKVSDTLAPSVAPRLNQIGAMLPYTPLYQLLLKKFKKPIVATSGNISNSPIVFDDEQAIKELSSIADFIVTNNRNIVVPQDDSVVKFSPFYKQKIILRRSRGYAPTYIQSNLNFSSKIVLAMGAMVKSTFSLAHQDNIFISQYLGDLENFDTQENYRHTLNHFLQLFRTQPEVILLDKHPQYASSLYGKEMAAQFDLPSSSIQHHQAHFAAILGENNLIHASAPILGVIWDGTGLGDDGHIWGGEFFVYQNYHFERRHHLDYVNFILGDKMAKEPRIAALSFCWGIKAAIPYLKEKFTKTEWAIYNKLLEKDGNLKTSSIGRLFDAIASLLSLLDKQTYEGEAALLLETKATEFFQKNGLDFNFYSFDEKKTNFSLTTNRLLNMLLFDLEQEQTKEFIAARFHFLLVKYIEKVAISQNIKKIAFSGGVFQNGLLVDLIQHHLSAEYDLFFHQQLSPNDENISFGQLVTYYVRRIANPPCKS